MLYVVKQFTQQFGRFLVSRDFAMRQNVIDRHTLEAVFVATLSHDACANSVAIHELIRLDVNVTMA
jgi:hypothetical protein